MAHVRNPDPQFPARPQHPDFWTLSEVAIVNDDKSELAGSRIDRIVGEVVDFESLLYVARHRASRISGDPEVTSRVIAAMFDGFMLGSGFEKRRGTVTVVGDSDDNPDGEHRRNQ